MNKKEFIEKVVVAVLPVILARDTEHQLTPENAASWAYRYAEALWDRLQLEASKGNAEASERVRTITEYPNLTSDSWMGS